MGRKGSYLQYASNQLSCSTVKERVANHKRQSTLHTKPRHTELHVINGTRVAWHVISRTWWHSGSVKMTGLTPGDQLVTMNISIHVVMPKQRRPAMSG